MKKILVGNRCPMCQSMNSVEVDDKDLIKWQNGESIQKAFPYLNANEREIIQTGICPTCWDKMFGIEPEEDEDPDFDGEFVPEDELEDEFDDMVEEDIDAFLAYILG